VTGGALSSLFGWRSVFWVNVPVVVAALGLTAAFVPESRALRPRRVDGPGQVLLTLLVGGSVALLIEAPRIGWSSRGAIVGAAGVVAVAVGFVVTEARRREPLIDPRLFRRPPFAAAVLGAVVVFVALSATLLLNTLCLQRGRGMSALATGAVTLPMALAAASCAPLSGVLVGRVGPRLPLLLAGAFLALGGACLVLAGHADLRLVMLAHLPVGIGFGFANAPITNTAVSGLPADRAGVAGGITSTARQFGAALGIAIAGSIVAGAPDAMLAAAARPGWIVVAGCGVVVLAVAAVSPAGCPPSRVHEVPAGRRPRPGTSPEPRPVVRGRARACPGRARPG